VKGISGQYPFETACRAAVDFLTGRTPADADRIAMLGQSLGGYFATRAAAYEQRLAACVVWGATGNFFANLGAHARTDSPMAAQLGQMERYFDVCGADAVKRELSRMSLDGVPELITCPTLILHGAQDVQIPVAAARWTFDHIRNATKRLVIIPAGTPGCTHCQLDSPITAQHHTFATSSMMCSALASRTRAAPPARILARSARKPRSVLDKDLKDFPNVSGLIPSRMPALECGNPPGAGIR
jgi:pimeloyl-ACP methyl ester carboxylesterase